MHPALNFFKVQLLFAAVVLLVAPFLGLNTAHANNRVALVIGNAQYEKNPLANPTNDSRDVAAKLQKFGFDVVYRENLKIRQVGGMMKEFKSKLTPNSTALVFYAGHGLQIRGENFFPVVDADIQSEEDIPVQSISLKQIMDILEDAKTKANIVFLDACRDNPFDNRSRSISRGLAKVTAPSGTLISYATRPGSVADDGKGRNGLYTEHLLKVMDINKPIEQLLKNMVTSIKGETKGRQEPWSEGSFEGEFCFGPCEDPEAEKNKILLEVAYWEKTLSSGKIEDYQAYLANYPNGTFVAVAKRSLDALLNPSTATAIPANSVSKQEVDKLIKQAEEKLRQEASNRSNLEKELEKAKIEAERLKNSQTNSASTKKLFVSPSF